MDSKKTYYYSWEPAAFLADHEFVMMDSSERGLYLTILLFLYQEGGRLEISKQRLKKLANWSKADGNFEKKFKNIMSCFDVKKRNRTLIISKNRVTREIEKSQAARQQRVKAANARWNKNDEKHATAYPPAMQSTCNADANRMEGNRVEKNRKESNRIDGKEAVALLRIFDRLAEHVRPRNNSDRTIVKSIINHVQSVIAAGQFNGGSWELLESIAQESSGKVKPMAYFQTAVKNHFGDYRKC